MSKDIVLRRDGVPVVLRGVKSITTPLSGGSNMTWLPEDETIPIELTATENGEYLASDSGYYGYSKVDVMVPGGKGAVMETVKSDGSIQEEYVEPYAGKEPGSSMVVTDPETKIRTYYVIRDNGTVVKSTVPSYAIVTTLPKTEYSAGESVSYSGAVITLYYGNDEVASTYNGGVLSYGSSAWNNYVDVESGTIEEVSRNGIVVMYVKQWWFVGGTDFGREYCLRAYYNVTVG